MSNTEHFFDDSIGNNTLPSPINPNSSINSIRDKSNNRDNIENIIIEDSDESDLEKDYVQVKNKSKKSVKSNFKLSKIKKWAWSDTRIETMADYYINIIHPYVILNNEPNTKVISLILKCLIKFNRHDVLKFLRENYSEIYLDKKNYKYLSYTPFQHLFWITEEHHDKILSGKINNFPKNITNIVKTIYEINQYGLTDTIFKKCLIKNEQTDLHPTKFESIFTIIDDPDNHISRELRNEIFKYVTQEYDYLNITINGQNYNFVESFIKYCVVEEDINCLMFINELFFFLKRFDVQAIKILTMELIKKYKVSDIKFKNNKKINNVINIISSKKKLSHGYSEYFLDTNIIEFKQYIVNTIVNNYESWIDEWIDNELSYQEDISEYNQLIQQGYRNIYCILGNFYYHGKEWINRDMIISNINDNIIKEIPYIEHSVLYFIANSGINLDIPTYQEKIFISNYIRMHFIDNISSNTITKVYIMDTLKNLFEQFNICIYC